MEGNIALARLLLAHGATVNLADEQGATPLHAAAASGNVELVTLLLDKGADIHATASGWTPLHTAAMKKQRGAAELLLARGADVNARTGYGQTPLDVLTEPIRLGGEPVEFIELLRRYGGTLTNDDEK